MSMWRKLRLQYSELSVKDVADKFRISKYTVYSYEQGRRKMPMKMQIFYLGLRGTDKDKLLISYLTGHFFNEKDLEV